VRRRVLPLYAALALAYLFLPVAVVILFSFNDNQGRFNFTWQGFTLKHWAGAFDVPAIFDSLLVSLRIAFFAALAATILGTLIALALVRYYFRGRSTTNLLLFLPMATPEVVLGSSLLAFFLTLRVATGFWTIVIAHIMFNISYVVVTVKARLTGFDRHLEEAAMDLYANEWQTFRKVTLPMIMPGVFAAFLLGFALSFDDFIITNFNSGSVSTFPKYIYISASRGIPAEANVIASAVFLFALVLVVAAQVSRAARAKRLAKLG
jgi:spermidine/putrescine transport system permease protein